MNRFELFPLNQTINADVYCKQLERLRTASLEKRPALVNRKDVLIHGDNARQYTAEGPVLRSRNVAGEHSLTGHFHQILHQLTHSFLQPSKPTFRENTAK